jgi:endoglucanase
MPEGTIQSELLRLSVLVKTGSRLVSGLRSQMQNSRTRGVFNTTIIRLVSRRIFTAPLTLLMRYTDDFIFSAWGKTTWGSDADKASLEADIAAVRGNFTDIPLIIGEWASSPVATETAGRWRYFDFFVRTAAKYNTSTILWDNGADFLNRATHQWRDPVAQDIYMNAVKGISNSLPDSTTDGSLTQQSSAYIYHKKGTNITDTTLNFILNGNQLRTVSLAGSKSSLSNKKDYSVSASGSAITFPVSFLQKYFTPTSPTGSITNLTVEFSRGAALTINMLQYATPVLKTSSSKLPAASTDLLIPISWAGQNRPAAVQGVKSDGTFLVDDWTQYLPALQQGRMTYGNQWDWTSEGVVIKAGALDVVRASGGGAKFVVEFYPREAGNNVTYSVSL